MNPNLKNSLEEVHQTVDTTVEKQTKYSNFTNFSSQYNCQ